MPNTWSKRRRWIAFAAAAALFVPADSHDGLAFAIAAQPIADYVVWRHELTGEPIAEAP